MNEPPPPGSKPIVPLGIRKVKHCIVIGSGKGGVGKTTVAVNLAMALVNEGFSVGLLDADIYGPSIPTMLNIHAEPEMNEERIIPLEKYGLHIMSIGFLIEENQPVV